MTYLGNCFLGKRKNSSIKFQSQKFKNVFEWTGKLRTKGPLHCVILYHLIRLCWLQIIDPKQLDGL